MYLFKKIAGKSENVEEGGISERRCDLPMFGQGMRRVRLSGGKQPVLKGCITTQTGKGDWGGSWAHGSNPPDWSHWSAGTRWWPRWCSARRYPVNENTTWAARWRRRVYRKQKQCRCNGAQVAYAPVESAWRQRWHFWTRSRPSDSRTSPVWWSGRTAGSKPGSRTLLTLAAWPDNSAHSSLSKRRAGFKTGLLNYFIF